MCVIKILKVTKQTIVIKDQEMAHLISQPVSAFSCIKFVSTETLVGQCLIEIKP